MQNYRAESRDAAIGSWRSAPAKSGREAFFQFGIDLRSAGQSTAEIADVLRLENGNARHAAERRREITRIIKRLRIVAAEGCLIVGERSRHFPESLPVDVGEADKKVLDG
jgi:hypothetical protein